MDCLCDYNHTACGGGAPESKIQAREGFYDAARATCSLKNPFSSILLGLVRPVLTPCQPAKAPAQGSSEPGAGTRSDLA